MLLSTRLRLEKLGKQLVDQLAHNIVTIDTGQYLPISHRERMAGTVKYELDDKEFRIIGGQHIWTYELGRGPTVNGGNGAVRRYVAEYIQENNIQPRGLDEMGLPITEEVLDFYIARKIHEEGSKPWRNKQPTGVLTEIINDQTVEKIENLLGEAYTLEIAEFLLKA